MERDDTNRDPEDFSRGELDRVIRRAVELQFEAGSDSNALARIDEREIRRIGAEVGIDDRFLRQAIGEVRAEHLLAEMPRDTGIVRRWMGDRFVRVQRVVPGAVDEIEHQLDDHLRVAETLSPVRARPGRSVWQPEEGVGAQLRRSFGWGGYRYELSKLTSLEVGAMAMEDGFVLVSLTADLKRPRNEAILGGTLGGGFTIASLGLTIGLVLGGPWLWIPTSLVGFAGGATGGVAIARVPFRNQREKVTLALEGILDRLETGEPLGRSSLGRRTGARWLLGGVRPERHRDR